MDAANDLQRIILQKLNANNFFMCSNKIEVVLRGRGLWGFVDGNGDGYYAGENIVAPEALPGHLAHLAVSLGHVPLSRHWST